MLRLDNNPRELYYAFSCFDVVQTQSVFQTASNITQPYHGILFLSVTWFDIQSNTEHSVTPKRSGFAFLNPLCCSPICGWHKRLIFQINDRHEHLCDS